MERPAPVKKTAAARLKRLFQNRVQLQMRVPDTGEDETIDDLQWTRADAVYEVSRGNGNAAADGKADNGSYAV